MILTPEQEMIRDAMRDFARERLAPFAAEWAREHRFPKEALKELAGLGAMGMVVPESWGGAGLDYVSLVLALEEIAAGDGATSTIVSVQNSLACGITMGYGNEMQKDRYLRRLASGEWPGCFCLTEPHVGSDASALRCRAERDGDHWVLNGVKQFITSGKNAQLAIVFAVTDKTAGKKGISAFLVPTDTPGYIVARIEDKMGQSASDTAQILFENCRVPADHLLGREGEGYKIALSRPRALPQQRFARAALAAALEAGSARDCPCWRGMQTRAELYESIAATTRSRTNSTGCSAADPPVPDVRPSGRRADYEHLQAKSTRSTSWLTAPRRSGSGRILPDGKRRQRHRSSPRAGGGPSKLGLQEREVNRPGF